MEENAPPTDYIEFFFKGIGVDDVQIVRVDFSRKGKEITRLPYDVNNDYLPIFGYQPQKIMRVHDVYDIFENKIWPGQSGRDFKQVGHNGKTFARAVYEYVRTDF